VRRGKVEREGFETLGYIIVNETDTYKYAGILQSRKIYHTEIKKQLTELISRY